MIEHCRSGLVDDKGVVDVSVIVVHSPASGDPLDDLDPMETTILRIDFSFDLLVPADDDRRAVDIE